MTTTTRLLILLLSLRGVPFARADMGSQLLKLTPADREPNDQFGNSVAVSGSTALVAAHCDNDHGSKSGSAYLFDVATGTQLAKLTPSDGEMYDLFGCSVAISGSTALVGAYGDDDNGNSSGSAYVFDVATGAQLTKLTPADGAADDYFGCSVALSGSTALIGANNDDENGYYSGSAYVFDVATGTQLAKLTPDDGAPDDHFGGSVAISGSMALVGALFDDDNGSYSGSAYVFDAATGTQLAKLTPDDGAPDDHFGCSVAVSGSIALVGADNDDDNGIKSGSAYLFDAVTGTQLAKLVPTGGAAYDHFGCSVAISGSTALVGAYCDNDNGSFSGSAYLFDVNTGVQLAKLTADDGMAYDHFGHSVATSGSVALVGAYGIGSSSGSAYLFSTVPEPSTMVLTALAAVGMLVLRRHGRPSDSGRHNPSVPFLAFTTGYEPARQES